MAKENEIQPGQSDEPEEQGSRSRDPELLTIGRMLRLMEDLDEPAKARVVAYLGDRYRSR